MRDYVKLALGIALVISTIVTADAATKHRQVGAQQTPAYTGEQVPAYNGGPPVIDPRCPASGGPACNTGCLPSGPPCRTHRDEA
jgi:hypothetical protein